MPDARFLGVHLPSFRLERCGYAASDRAVLIGFERNAMRVLAATNAARENGIHAGMSVSEARSIDPEIQVELHDPAGEGVDRGALLRVFERLSDEVQALGPEDLVLTVHRTATALGGEAALLERARALAEELGHTVGLAITDDPVAAMALARRHRERLVPAGRMAEALAHLPVAAVTSSGPLVEGMRAIGVEHLADVALLDIASITGRFGAEGSRVHQLASGRALPLDDAAVAWVAEDLPRVSTPLAGATTTLQLRFVLPGLLRQLADALADRDLAAVQLRCVLVQENTVPVGFGVRVGRPTRDVRTLEHLVRTRLETVRLEAPVDTWRIEVQEAVEAHGWQPGLTDRAEATEPLPDVLARLADALGDDAVFAAEPVDSWRPEGTWRPVPFPLAPGLRRPLPRSDDVVERQEVWERDLSWARPTQLYATPRLIEVRVEGARPAAVRLAEGWLPVLRREGPEVLSSDWWNPVAAWERVYWVVELPGTRTAWIHASDDHWWLHGWF
jgi:protein ImuB